MYEKINAINRENFATDNNLESRIAKAMMDIYSENMQQSEWAIAFLMQILWSGSETAEAASAVVPFLIEALNVETVKNRGRLALLLGLIAEGVIANNTRASARMAVRAGLDIYLRLFADLIENNATSPLQPAILYLLSLLDEDGEIILSRLRPIFLAAITDVNAAHHQFCKRALPALERTLSFCPRLLFLDVERLRNVVQEQELLERFLKNHRIRTRAYLGAKADYATRQLGQEIL